MNKREKRVLNWLRGQSIQRLEQAAISGELAKRVKPLVDKDFRDLMHLSNDELLREWPKDRPTGRISAQEAAKLLRNSKNGRAGHKHE